MARYEAFKKIEAFKWMLYVLVPIGIGYGIGGNPTIVTKLAEWYPSAASEPKGPYLPKELADKRPTLQSAYADIVLEQTIDAMLEDIKRKKERAGSVN